MRQLNLALPTPAFSPDATALGLLRDAFTSETNQHFGFRDENEEFPSLAVTFHGHRIVELLGDFSDTGTDTYERLRNLILEKAPKTIAMISACWDRESGGFKRLTPIYSIHDM
ncbi:MAG: hypothetical protein NTZ05_21015, partial [Chloroflexi bacterium]|nr:hypothetical protein [Chloroflexota bacterium]